jgi:IS5 family transposase
LADEALEDALYDSQALRGFAGIDLVVTTVPDATTVRVPVDRDHGFRWKMITQSGGT